VINEADHLPKIPRVRKEEKSFFERFGPEAKAILGELLEKYAEHGTAQFMIPDMLKFHRSRSVAT
jgi:hypothetical protein